MKRALVIAASAASPLALAALAVCSSTPGPITGAAREPPALSIPWAPDAAAGPGDGPRSAPSVRIVFDRSSSFGRVLVVDQGRRRYLRFGSVHGDDQSMISLNRPGEVPMGYIRAAALVGLLTPTPRRALMIGLGGGTFTALIQRLFPGVDVDAVEINPVVVQAAKRFFGVRTGRRFRIHVEGGARYIARAGRRFDLIMIDAYGSKDYPGQLGTPVFFESVKGRLAGGGVVVINVAVSARAERVLARTFRAAFPHAACVRSKPDMNLLLYGSTSPLPGAARLEEAARRLGAARRLPFDLAAIARSMKTRCRGAPGGPGGR